MQGSHAIFYAELSVLMKPTSILVKHQALMLA